MRVYREHDDRQVDVQKLLGRMSEERDQIKEEMLRKIRETKTNLLAKTRDQLHTTTKRVIMENEQMTTELQYQSRETEKIIDRLDTVVAENGRLKRELANCEDEKVMLAKRSYFLQKLIHKLNDKLKIAEASAPQQLSKSQKENWKAGLDPKEARIRQLETRIDELEEALRGSSGVGSGGGGGGGGGVTAAAAHLPSALPRPRRTASTTNNSSSTAVVATPSTSTAALPSSTVSSAAPRVVNAPLARTGEPDIVL